MSGTGDCGPSMRQAYSLRTCTAFSNSRLLSGRNDKVPEVPEVWLMHSCGTASSMVSNHSSRPWQALTSAASMAWAVSAVTSLHNHRLIAVKLFFSSSDGG
ncbi:hypothetical protein D3C76_1276430 [compost metagenome]